ncbi:hypothetical protein [Pseudomonas aeruginosa]|uniref:hypothetical protein n=1 Tax=Pseudomonas aeruginosa TaxID=287 RepID=UPI0039C30D04
MQKNENFAKQAVQAEQAERPEVVAWRYGFSGGIVSDKACLDEWKSGGEYQSLMTVAQHERIVKAWFERWKAYIELSAKIADQRDAANARLHEVATACATAEQERDATLARVAELERQGLVDAPGPDEIHQMAFEEGQPAEDGDGYLFSAEEFDLFVQRLLDSCAAPVAQAQHSVPEGFREKFKQCMELAFAEIAYYVSPEKARDPNSRARKAGALATELHAMLAAAPGKEVPQAWIDVQAERRRQVEAEGWTPEHDDEHSHGQMARAAACYALAGSCAPNDGTAALLVSLAWPWDEQWWKPSTARRDMVKACALALAEIERLDRAGISQNPQPGATTASS